MSKPSPKLELFASFAAVAKAAAHPRRLDLLEHISQGERSVDALAVVSGLSVANTSQHLLLMRRAGLLVSRRDGKRVLYKLSSNRVLEFLAALRGIAERNMTEAQQTIANYFHCKDSMEPLLAGELALALRAKSIVLLDVRPEGEFAMGHLKGAMNIPLKDLQRKLRSLPRRREVVAYCRGPYCVLAFEAVALLRRNGFAARRIDGGFPEFAAAGLPTACGL
jgi:rhodanese-related sulfurtransferase/DNA-binding transcriptional ArsR family regulator